MNGPLSQTEKKKVRPGLFQEKRLIHWRELYNKQKRDMDWFASYESYRYRVMVVTNLDKLSNLSWWFDFRPHLANDPNMLLPSKVIQSDPKKFFSIPLQRLGQIRGRLGRPEVGKRMLQVRLFFVGFSGGWVSSQSTQDKVLDCLCTRLWKLNWKVAKS